MSDETDAALIDDILDAAQRIKTYVGLEGRNGFMRQELVYDGVCMNLLRIGESARFLGEQTTSRLPEIPWPDLVSLRNRVAHGYETLKPETLWLIATLSLPDLVAALHGLRDAD